MTIATANAALATANAAVVDATERYDAAALEADRWKDVLVAGANELRHKVPKAECVAIPAIDRLAPTYGIRTAADAVNLIRVLDLRTSDAGAALASANRDRAAAQYARDAAQYALDIAEAEVRRQDEAERRVSRVAAERILVESAVGWLNVPELLEKLAATVRDRAEEGGIAGAVAGVEFARSERR